MRTLFCCVAAMLGAATVGAYAGADHADRHPNSTVVVVTTSICRTATDRSAVSAATTTLAQRVADFVTGKRPAPPPCPDHALVAPPEPQPMAPADAVHEEKNEPPAWVKDLDIPLDPPPADEQKAEPPACPKKGGDLEIPCPEGQLDRKPGDSEECEPTFMPLITDEDEPCKMPYAADDGKFDVFGWFFQPEVGKPPNCQEDPQYHQQYPACPFMGGCPAGKSCPCPAPQTPAGEKPISLRKGTEECPAHPEVDTTEFRPSDGRQGEFDRTPF